MKDEKKITIAPSILAADFAKIGEEARRAEDAGADALHVDVMDGHFVPNLTIGPQMVAALRRSTGLFLDVHLMIYQPFESIERYIEAGADRVTFHFEATEDVGDTLAYIRRCNKEAGLAFCPETSESFIPKFLDQIDLLLLMTVNPGFGGQAFLPQVLEKIRFARKTCDELGVRKGGKVQPSGEERLPPMDIQVDGGVNLETASLCVEAGANVLVAGTHLYGASDMKEAIRALRNVESSKLG